jgi:hypothetical protein
MLTVRLFYFDRDATHNDEVVSFGLTCLFTNQWSSHCWNFGLYSQHTQDCITKVINYFEYEFNLCNWPSRRSARTEWSRNSSYFARKLVWLQRKFLIIGTWWIRTHCFRCSVAASITIGIVSDSSCALTIALTQMQWAVCRFEVYHLYMCSPIGGGERLVVSSSIRNVLTSWFDSICYMSSRQVSRSQRQCKRLLMSCSASSLENPTCSHRQITEPRCPKSVLHVSRK